MNAPLLYLAVKSLLNRRMTAALTVTAIALSVALLLGVEKVRTGAKESFANTISGTDLIVGARSGSIQLLLYSVFRIGDATNNITWQSVEDISDWPAVEWVVPISLGDTHRGFRVVGTNAAYFEHYRFGRRQQLAFRAGKPFEDLYDAVVGADVAEELGYALGDEIVIAHGAGVFGFSKHDDKPFVVAGILARTGTPVDRSVHVSLEAIEAIHVDWQDGRAPLPEQNISAEEARAMDLQPKAVTAVLLGLKSRMATFSVQRRVNTYGEEALLAIIPGVALQQLWDAIGGLEKALLAVSVMVVVTGILGMTAVSLAALNERRREMAILRSVGARPSHIFALLVLEAGVLAAVGAVIGTAVLYLALLVAQPIIQSAYGFTLPVGWLSEWEGSLLGFVVAAGCLSGIFPALLAYRRSLSDGMAMRV
jgi:putative ABC transport system permease protein